MNSFFLFVTLFIFCLLVFISIFHSYWYIIIWYKTKPKIPDFNDTATIIVSWVHSKVFIFVNMFFFQKFHYLWIQFSPPQKKRKIKKWKLKIKG